MLPAPTQRVPAPRSARAASHPSASALLRAQILLPSSVERACLLRARAGAPRPAMPRCCQLAIPVALRCPRAQRAKRPGRRHVCATHRTLKLDCTEAERSPI